MPLALRTFPALPVVHGRVERGQAADAAAFAAGAAGRRQVRLRGLPIVGQPESRHRLAQLRRQRRQFGDRRGGRRRAFRRLRGNLAHHLHVLRNVAGGRRPAGARSPRCSAPGSRSDWRPARSPRARRRRSRPAARRRPHPWCCAPWTPPLRWYPSEWCAPALRSAWSHWRRARPSRCTSSATTAKPRPASPAMDA